MPVGHICPQAAKTYKVSFPMSMRQFLTSLAVAGAALTAAPAMAQTIQLSGAGASFPAPLFQRWFAAYNQVNPNVQVSYQSVGSGAGLEQTIAGTVDFGASEAPFSGERLENFRSTYGYEPLQIPMTGGYISLSYNLPGVEDLELKLTPDIYCGIVAGDLTEWDDPRIRVINPDLELPEGLPVTWAHRSDGSGTTFLFTNHLEAACPDLELGVGTSVDWPVGIGGQGNEGVAATIQQEEGAIGYLSYAYAALNDIDSAQIRNAAGNFVTPNTESAASALLSEPVPDDFALLVPNPSGENDYPIVGVTWVMLYRNYADAAKWEALKEVLNWALTSDEGIAIAEELLYIPIPAPLVERIQAELDAVTTN